MAKVLIVLAGVLVVLNGMTFLVVVNQEGGTPKGGGASVVGPVRGPSTPDLNTQKLESLVQNVQSVSRSLGDLSRKVDELQRKVSLSAARSIPAPAPVTAAAAPAVNGVTSSLPSRAAPPAVRKGPVEFSRPGGGQAPAAGGEQDPEDDSEEADTAPSADTAKPADPAHPRGKVAEAATGEQTAGSEVSAPVPADGAASAGNGSAGGADENQEKPAEEQNP